MVFVGTFCVVLLVLTTLIHYEILRMLTVGLPTIDMPSRMKLIVVIFGAFFAHVAEIFLYAAAYYGLVRYFGAGPLGHVTPSSLTLCIYFSAETYTSLGYGDVVPGGELRMLAGIEALNGLLLIGWSASYTYIAMERFWSDDGKGKVLQKVKEVGISSKEGQDKLLSVRTVLLAHLKVEDEQLYPALNKEAEKTTC